MQCHASRIDNIQTSSGGDGRGLYSTMIKTRAGIADAVEAEAMALSYLNDEIIQKAVMALKKLTVEESRADMLK